MASTKKATQAEQTTTPAKPTPAAKPAKPPVPQAQPLFRDKDGKALQGATAVYAVEERDEDGTPRLLRLVDLITGAASQTAAASEARKSGKLAADADAVTINVRYASAVNVPREPGAPAGAPAEPEAPAGSEAPAEPGATELRESA